MRFIDIKNLYFIIFVFMSRMYYRLLILPFYPVSGIRLFQFTKIQSLVIDKCNRGYPTNAPLWERPRGQKERGQTFGAPIRISVSYREKTGAEEK